MIFSNSIVIFYRGPDRGPDDDLGPYLYLCLCHLFFFRSDQSPGLDLFYRGLGLDLGVDLALFLLLLKASALP